MMTFAGMEGILLDPVYTGRAAGGLLDLIRSGKLSSDETILFWHTGGTPAIFAYEEFESLHPKNEAAPYVVYQIGRCYFDRLQIIDRDQTMAREALQTFERLIRTYPASPYAKKAEKHMNVCNRNLAEHEFYVGMFYYKTKHYKAALERFKTVVRSYPDLGVHRKALEYIPLCQDGIDNAVRGNN